MNALLFIVYLIVFDSYIVLAKYSDNLPKYIKVINLVCLVAITLVTIIIQNTYIATWENISALSLLLFSNIVQIGIGKNNHSDNETMNEVI